MLLGYQLRFKFGREQEVAMRGNEERLIGGKETRPLSLAIVNEQVCECLIVVFGKKSDVCT